MTAPLDPSTADKLAKLCGLFSSDLASAAAMADKLIRQRGLTWQQIILPRRAPDSIEAMIATALDHGAGILSCWEEGFLRGIRGRQHLTEKQLAKLDAIASKVRAARCEA